MYFKIVLCCECQEGLNGSKLCNGCECVRVVEPFDLRIPFCDKTCLVLVNFAVGPALDLKNSFRVYYLAIGRRLDFLVQANFFEGIQFNSHGAQP